MDIITEILDRCHHNAHYAHISRTHSNRWFWRDRIIVTADGTCTQGHCPMALWAIIERNRKTPNAPTIERYVIDNANIISVMESCFLSPDNTQAIVNAADGSSWDCPTFHPKKFCNPFVFERTMRELYNPEWYAND